MNIACALASLGRGAPLTLLPVELLLCAAACSSSYDSPLEGYSVASHIDAGDGAADAGAADRRHPPPGPEASAPGDVAAPDPEPYPIVLHHGFSGWKEANLAELNYFYGVAEHLNEHGENQMFETVVEPYHGTEQRAAQLAVQIDDILLETRAEKVNIIAHSQGGLDTRYLISTLGYGDRVATLTTISTPHRGTRVADAALKIVPDWTDWLIDGAADILGDWILDVDSDSDMRASLESLSEEHVKKSFNPANPNDPRVAYFSYAGRSNDMVADEECAGGWYGNPEEIDHIDTLLIPTAQYLKKPGEGVTCPDDTCANDGMVTVQSARWGTFMGCIPADHFDEVGQIAMDKPNSESGYSQRDFYLTVVRRIRDLGY